MDRLEALQLLNNVRTDEIVVAVYQAATTWANISNSDLNYTFTGAMGQGSSHALGLALGKPNKRVIVLDGDGSSHNNWWNCAGAINKHNGGIPGPLGKIASSMYLYIWSPSNL